MDEGVAEEKAMLQAMQCMSKLIKLFDEADAFLTEAEWHKAMSLEKGFSDYYALLSAWAPEKGRKLFNIVMKCHTFQHLVANSKYLNPKTHWTFSREDFVGKISLLTSSVSPGVSSTRLSVKVAPKYFGSQARYVGSEAPPFIFPRMAGAFEKAMVAGQKFLEGLRSLPSYKDAQQKQLRALLKQLGSVTDLTTGQSGKILSMLDEKLWDHESLQQLRQQIAAGCTTGRGRSPQPAGWLADLGNEPRLARGRDVHSCGCPDVFDPAGASCRSGRTA